MNSNSRLKTNNSTSTTSSPNNYMSPPGRIGRFIENIRNRGEGFNMTLSSQIIHTLTPNSKNNEFKSQFIRLEEDIADWEFRKDFSQLLNPKDYTNQEELKLRENMIWKIKKVIYRHFKLGLAVSYLEVKQIFLSAY